NAVLDLKAADVRYGHVVPIYETPAFPAVEEQQQHRNQGEPDASGKYARRRSRAIADVPVDQRDHHGNQVASHIPPRIRNIAYAWLSKEIGESENCRNQGHDDAGPEKPH